MWKQLEAFHRVLGSVGQCVCWGTGPPIVLITRLKQHSCLLASWNCVWASDYGSGEFLWVHCVTVCPHTDLFIRAFHRRLSESRSSHPQSCTPPSLLLKLSHTICKRNNCTSGEICHIDESKRQKPGVYSTWWVCFLIILSTYSVSHRGCIDLCFRNAMLYIEIRISG